MSRADARSRFEPLGTVDLARSGPRATRLGVGLAPIGGLYGPVSDEQALATVRHACASGIRLLDTAPLYGHGASERRAGLGLASVPRADYLLSTKVGRVLEPGSNGAQDLWAALPDLVARWDFSRDGVLRSLEQSLERLGVDAVDVVYLHDPEQHYAQAVEEAFPALDELRAQGVIRGIGVGTNHVELVPDFVRELELDCILLAGRYTLLDQTAFPALLELCLDAGVAVVAAGVFNSGLLAEPRRAPRFDYRPASEGRLAHACAVERVCTRHGVQLRAAAVQFAAAHPAVACVLVGVCSAAEVDAAIAAAEHPIPTALWRELEHEGLLAPGLPTP